MSRSKLVTMMFVAVCCVIFFTSNAFAGIFDPGAGWRTMTTKNFRVHYPERIKEVAERAAGILEEVQPKINEKWEFKPWPRTEVVLMDNTDEANGFSSVIPYNFMILFVTPPNPDSSLAHYDNWLRELIIHEYTHIVELNAFDGIWHAIRVVFGTLGSPNGINPTWLKEGITQYGETLFTTGGRGRGSYSEMVVRTDVVENAFPPIDVADGLSFKWPGYRGAYIYGLKFVTWLIETYGEDKFIQFDNRVRSSILLGMINHHAKNVYKKTFYDLWREWKSYLDEKYKNVIVSSDPVPEFLLDNKRDGQNNVPTVSPDGTKLVYSFSSPHGRSEIRMKDINTGEVKKLKKGQDATQFSWSPDGKKIVYSSLGFYKRYNRFYDLWLYDFDTGKSKKLTNGLRARDPDFMPDGNTIIFVAAKAGTDKLMKFDLTENKYETLTGDVPKDMQFANPRVSPDGRFIAVSAWRPGAGWRIYRCKADGTDPKRLTTTKGLVIEARPVWSKSGSSVIYASDEDGVSNIYKVSREGGSEQKLTNVYSGVFQPSITPEGEVIAQYYTSTGYKAAKLPNFIVTDGVVKKERSSKKGKTKIKEGKKTSVDQVGVELKESVKKELAAEEMEKKEGESDIQADRKYVAFSKSLFLPRFIMPGVAYNGDYFFASATTGGMDLLRWHTWTASGTYMSGAKHLGYNFNYAYNRYRPTFGVYSSSYAVDFGNLTFCAVAIGNTCTQLGRTVHFYEKRIGVAPYFFIPIQRHSLNVAFVYEDHQNKTALTTAEKDVLNLGKFGGWRGEYRYGDAEMFPASISKENGRNIRLTVLWTSSKFGSAEKNEQTIFSGDWREYINLGRHHELAVRAGGGMTWGDTLVQGTFGLGGALGEGSFGGAGSYNYYPFRGLPVSALSKNRVMLLSGEYRFPLMYVLRGLGTAPVFLKDISGAAFTDFGNAWNAADDMGGVKTFFGSFLMSAGLELRGDFILGHGMPFHGRVGYAYIVKNRGRAVVQTNNDPITKAALKNGMFILSLGTSF